MDTIYKMPWDKVKEYPCKWYEIEVPMNCFPCSGKNSFYYVDEVIPDYFPEQQYRAINLKLKNAIESIDESSFTVPADVSGECEIVRYGPQNLEDFKLCWYT